MRTQWVVNDHAAAIPLCPEAIFNPILVFPPHFTSDSTTDNFLWTDLLHSILHKFQSLLRFDKLVLLFHHTGYPNANRQKAATDYSKKIQIPGN